MLLTIPSALKIPAWQMMTNLNNEAAAHVLLGSIILLRWRTYVIYICNNLPHGSCKHTSVCKNTNHKIDVLDILSYLHFRVDLRAEDRTFVADLRVVYQKHPLTLRHHSKSVIF